MFLVFSVLVIAFGIYMFSHKFELKFLAYILKVLFVKENKNVFFIAFKFIKWALLVPCFFINSTARISKKRQEGICLLFCFNVTVSTAKAREKGLERFLSYFSDTHFLSYYLANFVTWCLCKYWVSVMVLNILCSVI